MANQQIPTERQVFISVDGNRLKQHAGNTVYLDNGKEFQLEIFNPTTSKVLAKIKINGNYISSSGLVLKPGQRVFLERYLDEAKKFKFETYSVDNTPETAGAIANNGNVEVEFYKEYIAPISTCTYIYNPPIWNNNIFYSSGTITLGGCIGSTAIGTAFTSTGGLGDITSGTVNCHATNSGINMDSINTSFYGGAGGQPIASNSSYSSSAHALHNAPKTDTSGLNRKMSKSSNPSRLEAQSFDFFEQDFERSVSVPEKKETGRVESGSYSNQSFVTDYDTYNSWVSSRVTWKILPLSQKPIEVSDLKTYCTSCGSRKKKDSHKFCPHCGSKFE